MSITDLFMQFGVLNNIRVTENQKIQYLTRLSRFFEDINYDTKIFKKKYQGKNSYIAIIGDLEKAECLVATHYDTPMINFSNYRYDPFNDKKLERASILNLTIPLIIYVLLLFLIISYYFLPQITNNIFNFHDILSGLIIIFILIQTYRTIKIGGIAKRSNLVRNTSSVVAILNFAKETKSTNKNYAFAFVDYGCINYFGYHVLSSYLRDFSKKIILLDSVGTPQIEFSTDKSNILSRLFKNIQFIYSTKENRKDDYMLINEAIINIEKQLEKIL